MAAVIKIEVTSAGGLEQLKRDATEVGDAFNAMGEVGVGMLRQIGAMAVNLASAGLSAIGGVLKDSISAARESNQVAAQTAQVIKSTGSAAGVTAQHVLDYASALSAAAGQSLFGDEQIAQSSNLLLTFTNIKGATLDAATAISVDMAQALGGAPKDAAIQLGKALNDPVKGITALTRVGVTFDEKQKATIQAMQEMGDTAGAQKIILDELNKEFGGSAKAAAEADGGFAQFKDRLGEMEETIGKAVLPVLNTLMGTLNDTVLPVAEKAANSFGPLVDAVQGVISAFQVAGPFSGEVAERLDNLAQKLGFSKDAAHAFEDAIFVVQDELKILADAFAGGGIGSAIDVLLYQLTGLNVNVKTIMAEAFTP